MTLFREFITTATLLACSLQLAAAAAGPLHSGFVGSGEDTTPTDLKEEEHEFVRRFNNLFSALLNFASNYNSGHVIDAKRAKAVRKAQRDLEKSEWFNPRKAD
jgi:hypothetical protein